MVSLIGGGKNIKPGEITLAHNGILFLDEFAEFPSFVLDALRQPMETNKIHIARAENHVTFPCSFQLIAAMNPCKCGYLGDQQKECTKAAFCGKDYAKKISGPILERIDIHIEVQPQFEIAAPLSHSMEESSGDILKRIIKVREFIKERGQKEISNSKIPDSQITTIFLMERGVEEILNKAALRFSLSLRQYYKTVKLARTIADMDFQYYIQKEHLLEALQFRQQYGN
jgi:magnesium chelatase family protein